jgi:cytochrome c553
VQGVSSQIGHPARAPRLTQRSAISPIPYARDGFVKKKLLSLGSWLALLAGLAINLAARAQAAPFLDNMAQRTLACTACHGKEGRAGPDGYYPRIAGKPAGYLYKQLLNFREGRRQYSLMTHLLDPLSEAYLMEIAQYFAALDLPYPAPRPSSAAPAELQRGEALVRQGDAGQRIPACVQCHGQALTGVAPDTPGLLGLPRDYINAQLGGWKTRLRRAHAPDCMADIAQQLSLDDVAAVSSWLATQPVPRNSKAADRLPKPPPVNCGTTSQPQQGRP